MNAITVVVVLWIAMMLWTLFRALSFAAIFKYMLENSEKASRDAVLTVKDDLWYFRLMSLMVFVCLAAGVAAFIEAVTEPPDADGPSLTAYLLLVFAFVLWAKVEVKAYFFRKRTGARFLNLRGRPGRVR